MHAARVSGTRGFAAPRAWWAEFAIRPAYLVLLFGLAALVVPTLVSLARNHWSTSDGAHGPIILVSGLWLLWREREHIDVRPGQVSPRWLALLAPLLLLYVFGRSVGMLGTETAALYAMLILLAVYYWGPPTVRRLWFSLAYLGFLIQPPYGIIAELTQPLKIAISDVSVALLHAAGYPIGRSGVQIQIAQYELLVQAACAGLSSLMTLMVMGCLYVHLAGPAGRTRKLLLLAGIVPIALLANLLRVIILVLLTYHAGDAVAQSFAHDVAGVATFALSMLGMAALDRALHLLPSGE